MKIKAVHYSATINLDGYSSEKIGFTVHLEDGESSESVVEALRQKVRDCALPNLDKSLKRIHQLQRQTVEIENKLNNARKQWELTAEFLRTQGIKPDAVDMPQFTNLLPQVESEYSEITEGEIEDEDRIF